MTEAEPLPTAILGASGYIGQHFARLLASHPRFAAPVLVGGERSEGRRLGDVWNLSEEPPSQLAQERLRPMTPRMLATRGVRVVFGAMPSGTAGPIEDECRRRGIHVFSNAADHRMDPEVPLLVPEINPGHLLGLAPRAPRALIVTNPNCTTTGLVLALAPVISLLAPQQVHVATYQALSGAGFPGVASLTIADNVVPFIREEEEKVEREANRIFGTLRGRLIRPGSLPYLAHCARVAVREGHLEAVTVVARRRPSLAKILRAWRTFDPLERLELRSAPRPPIEIRTEPDRPQPVRDRWAGRPETARGMAVVLGRIRWSPPYLRFFLLSHNAVRGGAGGSVLNAELADAYGLLSGARGR